MTEFVNPTGKMVILTGPNKEIVQINKFEKRVLDDYFRRYVPRFLRIIKEVRTPNPKQIPVPISTQKPPKLDRKNRRLQQQQALQVALKQKQERLAGEAQKRLERMQKLSRVSTVLAQDARKKHRVIYRKIVGTSSRGGKASSEFESLIKSLSFPISNDIGVGILSFNRLHSLRRLVESIRKHTNLTKTTVFISDESTDESVKKYIGTLDDFVVIDNDQRLGIAGNTNRLMRCLNRFNHRLILNDDVEVIHKGWENFYVNASLLTKIHHFCMRQPGVYGAGDLDGAQRSVGGLKVLTIQDKPQGAVISYDKVVMDKVGFFDEEFGIYGMEHVDWSTRVSNSGIQPKGFHDVFGSVNFFRVHPEKSAVKDRSVYLAQARNRLKAVSSNNRIYVSPSKKSEVEGVTYIVPFRGVERTAAIRAVLLNIKAQLYPYIDIIMVEQDEKPMVDIPNFQSVTYLIARNNVKDQPFTKAMAFNLGMTKCKTKKIILHDADMLVQSNYTKIMSKLLDKHEAVHAGKYVYYLTRSSTDKLFKIGSIVDDMSADRVVNYFEGGSVGCRYDAFVKVGGFNEDFIGYGCEDTEFFGRLASLPDFYNNRIISLIHIWHGRTPGWSGLHENNKRIEKVLNNTPMEKRIRDIRNNLLSKYKFKKD